SITGGTCTTTVTNASGQCTLIVHSTQTGVATVHASSTFSGNGVSLTRATGDSVGQDGPNNTKTWVDAKITLDGNSTNEVGHDHTFTVTVSQAPGTATVRQVSVAHV